MPRIALLAIAAVFASACSDELTTTQDNPSAIRVINASGVPLEIRLDGEAGSATLGIATVSSTASLAAGSHVLGVRAASGTWSSVPLVTVANQTLTTVVAGTASTLAVSVLADTGSIVPAGKSKLRVAHLAGSAPAIEIWRTQPDFQTPIHIMTPFAAGATSPYLQSDPGAWEVFVTAAGGGTKLTTTGAVNVPSGERRTVVLLDSLGVLRLRVIAE